MDVLISVAIGIMLAITIAHMSFWLKENRVITSPHLRSASVMLVCLTLLVFVLFGSRLFLKPEVTLTYTEKMYELYNSVSINDKAQQIVDSKRVIGCEVELQKGYPLMWVMGRDRKVIKFKLACDALSPEMKTEIANVTSYLKEEKQ